MQHFTEDEAREKLGTIVATRVPGRRIPQGTRGRVIYARLVPGGYQLGIQWLLKPAPWGFAAVARPPFLTLRRQAVVDWVRKDQYRRYLVEETTEQVEQAR